VFSNSLLWFPRFFSVPARLLFRSARNVGGWWIFGWNYDCLSYSQPICTECHETKTPVVPSPQTYHGISLLAAYFCQPFRSWLGFRTRILRFPAQRFTVIILSNVAELEPNILASKITKIYLADKLRFPVPKHLEPKLLEQYVGRYEFSPRVTAVVSLQNGELWLKPPGQEKMRLRAESEDSFFLKDWKR
jgi:hypothetical protein